MAYYDVPFWWTDDDALIESCNRRYRLNVSAGDWDIVFDLVANGSAWSYYIVFVEVFIPRR
jgi:hypothetical protein